LDALLEQVPNVNYNHAAYILRGSSSNKCGTVGCSLGHAVASGKFPGLKVRHVENAGDFGRHFYFSPINGKFQDFGCTQTGFKAWADYYFGPDTYNRIFDVKPYETGVLTGWSVKQKVQRNLQKVATEFENM
jgi:hypothetical protein